MIEEAKKTIKNILIREILTYDVNEVHKSMERLGFSTGWEYLDKELIDYDIESLNNLLEDLENHN